MLLRSEHNKLTFKPALPDDWQEYFVGARGDIDCSGMTTSDLERIQIKILGMILTLQKDGIITVSPETFNETRRFAEKSGEFDLPDDEIIWRILRRQASLLASTDQVLRTR